jgi:hypothetical protein
LAGKDKTVSSSEQISAIAKEAFIYGYPIVDNHNVIHKYVLDRGNKEYKAPFNQIGHNRNVASPEDKAVVSMNVDTPYSFAWLDLRAEPVVLSIPPFEKSRYVSVELIDLYTYIVGYISPRTNGNAGGDFLVAGPGWRGETPAGIKTVFHSPTQFLLALYRTQLFGADDLENVHALQDQYGVRTLSEYLEAPAPPAAAPFIQVQPIDVRKESEALQFFAILNAMLAYMPALDDETELRRRFTEIGIIPWAPFEPEDGATSAALVTGMQQGLMAMYSRARTVRSSAEIFGSREALKDDYLSRAVGALLGIYGNAAEEYLGVGYQADADGQPFDGNHKYRIKFTPQALPPVGAFWSITAYNASKFLLENPIDRYVINSPMLPDLLRDPDGGFTLYLQSESPGKDLEANWLPVSQDAFNLAFRTYQPGPAIMDGSWQAPPVARVE